MNDLERLTPANIELEKRRRGNAKAWIFLRTSVWLGSCGLIVALVFRSDVVLIVAALGLFAFPLAETHKYAPKEDPAWITAVRKTQWIALVLLIGIGITSLFFFENYSQCFSQWSVRPNLMTCE